MIVSLPFVLYPIICFGLRMLKHLWPSGTPLPDHYVWSYDCVVETALKILTEDVSMFIRDSGPSQDS